MLAAHRRRGRAGHPHGREAKLPKKAAQFAFSPSLLRESECVLPPSCSRKDAEPARERDERRGATGACAAAHPAKQKLSQHRR
jgi:hypothetical protein